MLLNVKGHARKVRAAAAALVCLSLVWLSGCAGGSVARCQAVAPPDVTWASPIVYVVREGDTLAAIAERFRETDTMAEIIKRNGLKDPDSIAPGQPLLIRWYEADDEVRQHSQPCE